MYKQKVSEIRILENNILAGTKILVPVYLFFFRFHRDSVRFFYQPEKLRGGKRKNKKDQKPILVIRKDAQMRIHNMHQGVQRQAENIPGRKDDPPQGSPFFFRHYSGYIVLIGHAFQRQR